MIAKMLIIGWVSELSFPNSLERVFGILLIANLERV
jgi:hypothetical protein